MSQYQTLFLDMDGVIADLRDGSSYLWGEPGFWETLPLFDWSKELVQTCHKSFKVHILSSPGAGPASVHGKILWLQKHFPELVRGAIFTKAKYLLSRHGRILLDDDPENIGDFAEAGGAMSKAILFPRPHNEYWWDHSSKDNIFCPPNLKEVFECLNKVKFS